MTIPVEPFNSNTAERRAVILVEGRSDQIAVETLASRSGRNLASEGVEVVPMGGIHAIGQFLTRFGPLGDNLKVAGLYDIGEEHVVRRGLVQARLADAPLSRAMMEDLGFFACVLDLEDELIRALGVPTIEAVIAAEGDFIAFRILQKQPEWRSRSAEAQLRRFFGSGATRKWRYAGLLVEALELDAVPRPLRGVLKTVP